MAGGIQVTFEGDVKKAQKKLTHLQRQVIPQAASSALNRTAKAAQVRAGQLIRQDLALSARFVKSRLTIKQANRRTLTAHIRAANEPHGGIPLRDYKPKTKVLKRTSLFGAPLESVSVKIKRGRRRRVVKGAFITRYRKWGGQVLRRKGKARGPVKALHGPSVSHKFMDRKVLRGTLNRAYEQWPRNFDSQMRYRLGRLK